MISTFFKILSVAILLTGLLAIMVIKNISDTLNCGILLISHDIHFVMSATDHVLCLNMVEMAGKEHIHKCEDALYILNRDEELQNEGRVKNLHFQG